MGALAIEHAIAVTVIGRAAGRTTAISLRCSCCNECARRAGRFAFGSFPVQPILESWVTYQFQCVDAGRVAIVARGGVFILRIHIALHHADGAQFIGADAAVYQLIRARVTIKHPLAIALTAGIGLDESFLPVTSIRVFSSGDCSECLS